MKRRIETWDSEGGPVELVVRSDNKLLVDYPTLAALLNHLGFTKRESTT